MQKHNDGFYVVHPNWYEDGVNTIMRKFGDRWQECGSDTTFHISQCKIVCAIDENSVEFYAVPD